MSHAHLEPLVQKLLTPLGKSQFKIERLKGGGNNQAYEVVCENERYFLKLYHQDPEDPRRRGETEFNWLKALWQSGFRGITQPYGFAEDHEFSAGLYEYVSGKAIQKNEVNSELVQQAIDFIRELNQYKDSPQAKSLPIASEACFSLDQHWQTIEKRVARLEQIESPEAIDFFKNELIPVWQKISKNKPENFTQILAQEDRILSPSDFGFHNAILTEQKTLRFIDFEYAGWDDPAKLICDFFNQVSVPVPLQFYNATLETFGPQAAKRAEVLFPLYQMKWICILLNHFLPSGGRRRKFALQNTTEWETLLKNQLQMAQAKLKHIKL